MFSHRVFSHLITTLCIVLLTISPVFADSINTINFYNPETNISSFTSLKRSYDNYLSKLSPYRLQPFKNPKTFISINTDNKRPILLTSSWFFQQLNGHFKKRLKISLVATKNGKSTARKVLVTKKSLISPADLKQGVIASSANISYAKEVLTKLLVKQPDDLIKSIQFLNVPKDIDALMSVAFGVADAAITLESTMEKLAQFNPGQYKTLSILLRTDEILLPVLSFPQKTSAEEQSLIRIFQEMKTSRSGRRQLKMIGIDGWKTIDSVELRKAGIN